MSTKNMNGPDAELERLYRDAGDVEPGPGLDRTVRARAEASLQRRLQRRSRSWAGGLVATTSVALVAIAVVLQQPPPDESRAPVEARTTDVTGAREALADRAESAAPAAPLQLQKRAEREAGGRARAMTPVAEERATAAATGDAAAGNARDLLAEIRALVEAGELDRARQQIELLRQRHPETEIPESLVRGLERLEQPGTPTDDPGNGQ